MTDPVGVSFVSYRRVRLDEVALLVGAQHDHGVPTWQDIKNLANEQTEVELVRVISDPGTANAVLWITPEVEHSPVILKVEVPEAIKRKRKRDGFFIVPVAAGDLSYQDAESIASSSLGLDDFKGWNLEKIPDPLTPGRANEIAETVLLARLGVVNQHLAQGEPISLGIFTMGVAPEDGIYPIQIDWTRHFNGRVAPCEAWSGHMIPAIDRVVDAVKRRASGRAVVAQGQPSLSAALILGAGFMEPSGVGFSWLQNSPGEKELQEWSLNVEPESAPLQISIDPRDTASEELIVGVGLRANIGPAIKASINSGAVPECRGHVMVEFDEGHATLETPGQAKYAVEKTVEAIKQAKSSWSPQGGIHLFLAAPAGFAVLLGQRLNALGPVQMYEYDSSQGGTGTYVPSVGFVPGK